MAHQGCVHAEAVMQGFLLEVAEPYSGEFLKGPVTKHLMSRGLRSTVMIKFLQPRTKNRVLHRVSVTARASPSTGP